MIKILYYIVVIFVCSTSISMAQSAIDQELNKHIKMRQNSIEHEIRLVDSLVDAKDDLKAEKNYR